MSEEPSADQTDLSASPPPPYVPPPPLSLSDITTHEPQDRLGHSDVAEGLTTPVDEVEDRDGGAGFEFDDKEDEDVEELSRAAMEQDVKKQGDRSLEREQCDADQGMLGGGRCDKLIKVLKLYKLLRFIARHIDSRFIY